MAYRDWYGRSLLVPLAFSKFPKSVTDIYFRSTEPSNYLAYEIEPKEKATLCKFNKSLFLVPFQ